MRISTPEISHKGLSEFRPVNMSRLPAQSQSPLKQKALAKASSATGNVTLIPRLRIYPPG
jgi:hypothetical protein